MNMSKMKQPLIVSMQIETTRELDSKSFFASVSALKLIKMAMKISRKKARSSLNIMLVIFWVAVRLRVYVRPFATGSFRSVT